MSTEKKTNPSDIQKKTNLDQNEKITRRQALKRMAKGAVYVMGVIGIIAGTTHCEPPYDDYYDYSNYYYNYYGNYYSNYYGDYYDVYLNYGNYFQE